MNTTTESSTLCCETELKFPRPWPLSLPHETSSSAWKDPALKTRVLVAEDDSISLELVCVRLAKWGYEVVPTQNGTEAMTALRKKDAPSLAILDWMMPDMDGIEICRRVREVGRPVYLILLTARGSKENVVEGLCAGADDYLTKPFDKHELHARILVGLRTMALQAGLTARVRALEASSAEIRELKRKLVI